MKTRCPECQTVFRVTPEQLKARAGKVRCGQCRTVFNAPECLISPPDAQVIEAARTVRPSVPEMAEKPHDPARMPGEDAPLEIPGYGRWAEDVMAPEINIHAEKPMLWPFFLATAALMLTLAGQILFHFRGELAISTPALRPALEAFSLALGHPLPLPRHVEWVSIETSDLQIDPARNPLLVLNATLRNKASYGQAHPSLELSLTDTQNAVIARRTFGPKDYLPEPMASTGVFHAYSDTPVRLWIEAEGLKATGYRLLAFYP
jgi:predicted Zn finger-like uncharacterized protein